MTNPKNPAWYSGGMSMDMSPGAGNVFYLNGVDGVGSDANSGLTPDAPLLTMTYALSLCVADNDDYIVVLDYWQPTGETWPISVDVNKVHIIGKDGAGASWPMFLPPADTAAFSIAADRVELARLEIDGGATHGAVENDAAGARWGLLVRDCTFAVMGAAQDGIRNVAAGDMPYLTVKNCRFGQGITRDGIRIEHNATRAVLGGWNKGEGNFFDRIPGVGVNVVGNGAEIGIFNNVFAVPANTAGGAITLSAGTANSPIFRNSANFGDTDMGNNPYTDGAGAGANNWGENMQGITLAQPA